MSEPAAGPMAGGAVVLLSGGLDSAVTLAMALHAGLACTALTFDYGQRHRAELAAARRVASAMGIADHRVIAIDLRGVGGSALTDDSIEVPTADDPGDRGPIPVTYVPARNMLFLSVAVGLAEAVRAGEVHIGVNAVDFSGYPDCRPEFIRAFEAAAALGTRTGVLGFPIRVVAPLRQMGKAEIIRAGAALGVDFGQTISCYEADATGRACGVCESCAIRRRGFEAAGMSDPTRYR